MKINKCFLFTILVYTIISCGESEPLVPKEEPDAVSEIVPELIFPTGASNKSVTFTTNKKWEALITFTQGDKSWCTISPTVGEAGTVNITVATTDNIGYDDRSVTLTIKTGKTVKNINITQKQKNAIIISKDNYEITEEGGVIEIEVNTNVDLKVTIPTGINWIKEQFSETRALSTKKITLIVEKNTELEPRKVEISIKDKNSDLTDVITVIQSARKIITRTVNVETAGTLNELLGSDFLLIEELNVSGNINGTDINIIREMAGSDRVAKPTAGVLYKLDLSDVKIVEGGSAYIYPDNSWYDACYTSKDVIGDFMFYKCNSLKEIILPKTILGINDFSISSCNNLESVKMDESVKYIRKYGFQANLKLKNINLSDNIEIIGEWAFGSNESLESIILPKNIKLIGNNIFTSCEKLKDIEFPTSITTISEYAFEGCKSLEKINLPNSITIVSIGAFYNCINIKSVTFGNEIISIGADAFDKCDGITEIICKNPVPPTLGNMLYVSPTFTQNVFKNCNVYIPIGSYEAYYTSKMWRYFENLIEKEL